MAFASVQAFQSSVGTQTTLDDAPPTFTKLEIQDPTASNTAIVVTFALNEPGTAYCRATRLDSGETEADVPISRILTADWSAEFESGMTDRTLELTNLENVNPALTNRDDEVFLLTEATQYNVYCFASDNATDSFGFPRPQYMTQDYVGTAVGSASNPSGGTTKGVWVADTTAPTLIFVGSESVDHETIQMTLQLDEPGTIWCAAAELAGSPGSTYCKHDQIQDITSSSGSCYWEMLIKGSATHSTVFRSDVPEAYRDVKIEVNRILQKDEVGSTALQHETGYSIFCFAEDDWQLEADAASVRSVNYAQPSGPRAMAFASVQAFQSSVGTQTTLDDAPPTFTKLEIQDPTASNTAIVVTFALNEPGTAYCRATRLDSGETEADVPISRILTADWSGSFSASDVTITMTTLENVLPSSTNRDDVEMVVEESYQYNVYCVALDDATDSFALSHANYMTQDYVVSAVVSTASPQGGATTGVWVLDSTAPTISLVAVESVGWETLQVTLQLDEPGTIWCQVAEDSSAGTSSFCREDEVQDVSSGGTCYFELFTKGSAGHGTTFRTDVHEPYADVDVEMNRIWQKDRAGSAPLEHQKGYKIFCFAEDDWAIQAQTASSLSPNFIAPSLPNKIDITASINVKNQVNSILTLDESPPAFTLLVVEDPTALNTVIAVTFALNEAGTAYCRAVRSESAEAAVPLAINRILSAGWSAAYDTAYPSANINISGVQSSPYEPLDEGQKYDVYCWAKDNAQDSFGNARPQYMTQDYVSTHVISPASPAGAKTPDVWVVDSTPPSMIFVGWDAVKNEETLQVTLQLNEPGTIWCQAAEISTATTASTCREDELQDSNAAGACYFESYLKGSTGTTFRSDVHEAFQDVEVEMNRLPTRNGIGVSLLAAKTDYKIFCFAEDDWNMEAFSGSPNFASPSSPNPVLLVESLAFKNEVGTTTTLDVTPPNLTIQGSAASEDRIFISLEMDEPGTAWCRAVRKGSAAPLVQEVLETSFSSLVLGAGMSTEVNVTAHNSQGEPLQRGTDYDVYCYGRDLLCLRCSHPSGSTARAVLESKTLVRTADTTPPQLRVLAAESIASDRIQLTLQVDEGAKVWCAAWQFEPAGMATNYESLIKSAASTCQDSLAQQCGSFWVYDIDDLEDSLADGAASTTDYEAGWQYDRDFQIVLLGLTEATAYAYIYCYAEDDENDGLGLLPNKMYFDSSDAGPDVPASSMVKSIRSEIGAVTTLDESPPTFTELSMADPTVAEGIIAVTLSLNEAGTVYCRAARVDSGETSGDMHVNRILSAGWSASHAGPPSAAVTIWMTHLESITPINGVSSPFEPAVLYDVYCFAQDDATTTAGFPRPNYMTQDYVSRGVANPSSPIGGRTSGVWVSDSTPPTIIFVSTESVSSNTIQMTLQLDEPGTLWCAAAELDSSSTLNHCKESAVQDTQPNVGLAYCYYETFIKGSRSDSTVFKADVHEPFRDIDIEVNKIWESDQAGSADLEPETGYRIFCFAEDDWVLQTAAETNSPNYATPSSPNKSPLTAVQNLVAAIGTRTTLDESPPSFTKLDIENPTAANDQIVVTFALNEPGTAFCRARREDSAAAGSGMPVSQILAAGWSQAYTGSGDVSLAMMQISLPDPSIGALDSETTSLEEQHHYEVYCWAQDDAIDGRGTLRRNYQLQSYVDTAVGLSPSTSPLGGKIQGIWVVDSTAPSLLLVQAEAAGEETLQVTLQLDEPGTIWCAALEQDSVTFTPNCKASELQDASGGAYCHYEDYIKGGASDNTVFRKDVHQAFQDVDIEINRIWQKDKTGSSALAHQGSYEVFCFAEDDWKIQANSASNSAGYVAPAGPVMMSLTSVQGFASGLGTMTTLDEAPPSFTTLQMSDPSASEGSLIVTFTLNEAGTAYCRATRRDSGETQEDMPINRILTASWSARHDGSGNTATIAMDKLENVNPSLTNRDDEDVSLAAGTQYDVYCWAQDDAQTETGVPRSNYMTQDYISAGVAVPTSPSGGYTPGVWVTDSSPPTMLLSSAQPLSEDTFQVTLQLSEPGTVWCGATVPNGGSSTYCRPDDLQDNSFGSACYYEYHIKGSVAQGTTFRAEVPTAYQDVQVEVNRMAAASPGGSGFGTTLSAQTSFAVLCFAQDSWEIRSQAAHSSGSGSPNFVTPTGPNGATLTEVKLFMTTASAYNSGGSSGTGVTTLDLTPPMVSPFLARAPPTSESSLEIFFSLDEAATLYCLALASGAPSPHVSRVAAEGSSLECTAAQFGSSGCSNLVLVLSGLLRGEQYDVHCHAEDDNVYPQTPNRVVMSPLSAQVNDITPPVLSVVRSCIRVRLHHCDFTIG
eukprot:TRINITY_DN4511_c0_g1_i3.p1 TRINITY_DN4511_c0_g1~~TRINITY_DN4511_c0_g1_i3.p1  ORF type:complete len:2354 (-),score=405.61 TRINITY_DN4511_c0_g1_i3:1928-8902(-)